MKKILGIVGVTLIAGAVIYTIIDRNRRKNEFIKKDKDFLIENQNDEGSIIENEEELKKFKNDTLNIINIRHDQAVNFMKESVKNIEKMNNDLDRNDEDLKKISRELDELLGENNNG